MFMHLKWINKSELAHDIIKFLLKALTLLFSHREAVKAINKSKNCIHSIDKLPPMS